LGDEAEGLDQTQTMWTAVSGLPVDQRARFVPPLIISCVHRLRARQRTRSVGSFPCILLAALHVAAASRSIAPPPNPSQNCVQAATPPHRHPPDTTSHPRQLYGLLYTYSRERWDSNKRWVAARLLLEHCQIIVFMLQPEFLWSLKYEER